MRVWWKMVKEEREYVMLSECKLNNSCKSGNSLVNKYIDLNESWWKMVKEEREYAMLNECKLNNSCKSGNRVL